MRFVKGGLASRTPLSFSSANSQRVYEAQRAACDSRGCVFVLSAFSEFLMDYFKRDFWNSHVRRVRFSFEVCEKRR